jgi:hypothetical protein
MLFWHDSWGLVPSKTVGPHILMQHFYKLDLRITSFAYSYESVHLLLSYTTMVSPSMDAKSRKSTKSGISKAPGFHWWVMMHHMKCTRAVNQWRFRTNTKKWAHSCLHQIVDTLLVLLGVAAIWRLCIGLRTTTWPTLLQPFSNSASRNLWVGSYFLEKFSYDICSPDASVASVWFFLYDFNISYILTYFFNLSSELWRLMIDTTIVLYNYSRRDFYYTSITLRPWTSCGFLPCLFLYCVDGVDRLASFKKAKLKASGHPYPIQVTHSIDSIKAPVAGVMWFGPPAILQR